MDEPTFSSGMKRMPFAAGDTTKTLPSQRWVRVPQQATRKDLVLLGVMLILFVLPFQGIVPGGWTSLLYLVIGCIGILIPTSLATAKLGKMYPGEGGFYVWIYKALGSFWDVLLVLFCGWLPPLFLIAITSQAIIGLMQNLLGAFGLIWFTEGWQVALVMLPALGLIWLIGHLPLRISLRIITYTCYTYLALIAAMGLAASGWLVTGHVPTDASPAPFAITAPHMALFTTMILGFLGIHFPQNLGGEIREPATASRYLLPAVIIIIVGYLLAWFAVTEVFTPAAQAGALSSSAIGNIGLLFAVVVHGPIGYILGSLATLVLLAYLIASDAATSILQSRLVVMMAKDRRLPVWFGRLDQGVPRRANLLQMVVVGVLAILFNFIIPAFSDSPDSSVIVVTLVVAAAFSLWIMSTIGLLVSAIVLVVTQGPFAEQQGGPSNVGVVFWCGAGIVVGAVSLIGIVAFSQTPSLDLGGWILGLSLLVCAPLAIGVTVAYFAPEPEDIKQLARWANAAASSRTEQPPHV